MNGQSPDYEHRHIPLRGGPISILYPYIRSAIVAPDPPYHWTVAMSIPWSAIWSVVREAGPFLNGVATAGWLGFLLNSFGMQERLFRSKADILEQRRLNDISAKDAALHEKDVIISGLRSLGDNLRLLGGPEMAARVEGLTEERDSNRANAEELASRLEELEHRHASSEMTIEQLAARRDEFKALAIEGREIIQRLTRTLDERQDLLTRAVSIGETMMARLQVLDPRTDDAVQKALDAALLPDE
jgi:hypothetical protein